MTGFDLRELRATWGRFDALLAEVGNCVDRAFPVIGNRGSQAGEDDILRELLAGDGAYVDFGAGDPVRNSNTWQFYERHWQGLLVEPLFWH